MNAMLRHWRRGLYLLAAACALLLLLSPGTRWILDSYRSRPPFFDSSALLGDAGEKDSGPDHDHEYWVRALNREVARRPDDVGLQIAYALRRLDTSDARQRAVALNRLHTLLACYPRNRSVQAVWLSLASSALLSTSNDKPKARDISEFQRIAAEAERLDPTNAYFPTMRAIGFFASGQDAAAIEALHRAAGAATWDDCVADYGKGAIRLIEAASRPGDPWASATAATFVSYPHLGSISTAARLARNRAIAAERAGRAAEGLDIRGDLMRLGALLRAKSRSGFGTHVGVSLQHIAMDRPGGGSKIQTAGRDGKAIAARWAAYAAYLKRMGCEREARGLPAQRAADEAVGPFLAAGVERFDPTLAIVTFTGYWIASLFLSMNVLSLFLLAIVGGALGRLPGVKDGPPFTKTASGLIGAGLALAILAPTGIKLVPMMLVMVLAVWAWWRHIPLGAALLHGVRLAALPLACVLLIADAGVMARAAQMREGLITGTAGCFAHEGRYYASLLGRAWPG